MADYVKHVRAVGIHNRFDIEQDFFPGVNVLHGKNGTGKTTLLHIIANVLNGDYRRFAFLPFQKIDVTLDDKTIISIKRLNGNKDAKVTVHRNREQIDAFSVDEARHQLTIQSRSASSASYQSELRRYIELFTSLHANIPTAYFPAFRTLIEAAGNEERGYYETMYYEPYDPTSYYHPRLAGGDSQQVYRATSFSRRFFGEFVPWINYPSPVDVSRRLAAETQQALNVVAKTDRQLLSTAFLDIFATLSQRIEPAEEQPETILEGIQALFGKLEDTVLVSDPSSDEEVYSKLRELVRSFQVRSGSMQTYVPILEVYRKSLEQRSAIQEQSSTTIKLYLDSVNYFLENKDIVIRRSARNQSPRVEIQFADNTHGSIQALSSGERQIVTLIYSATHMSGQKVVLIDEPEISLHIDWQSQLLPKMVEQLHERQIITCTHSPLTGASYENRMMELRLKSTSNARTRNRQQSILEDVDEEITF